LTDFFVDSRQLGKITKVEKSLDGHKKSRRDCISNHHNDILLNVSFFTSHNLFQTGNPFLKMLIARMVMKN
jgi:hypothetical protein